MVDVILNLAALIALAALLLSAVRGVLGPGASNRTVALDAMTIISVSLIAYLAHYFGRVIYLDVALVYALISFVGVVALARYLERGL